MQQEEEDAQLLLKVIANWHLGGKGGGSSTRRGTVLNSLYMALLSFLLKARNLPMLLPLFSDCEYCSGIGKEHRAGRGFRASC